MSPIKHRIKALLNDERGFTLLEMLVVLAIFLIVQSAILYFSHEPLVDYTEKQVMSQNELLIRMAQLSSIETGSPHSFQVVNCNRIIIKERNQPVHLYDQRLPRHVELFLSTPGSSLIFNTRGNVQAFGRLTYHFENVSYQYSINIGKGRILDKEVFHGATGHNTCGNIVSGRHFIFSLFDDHSPHV
ncbi:prepilin-type N-terminal cleavage/methylation domain-containing protein [Solibacillus silvestris]|uniref:prepilin-type N-terminal cleavage/methylation domain-containing protein n=1 Tax=Solibacillus silvestris TaxID=76853 RepID=UPI003F7D9970